MHVTRAPVGGIFRHILDLARGQAERGHEVASSATARPAANARPRRWRDRHRQLKLGVARFPIQRELTPNDFLGFLKVRRGLLRSIPT